MEESLNALYLVKVEAGANNNKYYRLIPNGDRFDVQFGRIGTTGFQTASYPIYQWDKKLHEKLKKGYVNNTRLVAEVIVKEQKKEYMDISNPSIASIVSRLQSMARQAIADNYTIASNAVTTVMIFEAQSLLNDLITADTIESFNEYLLELFKTIPRKMKKVKDYLAVDKESFAKILQSEQDLLDVMRTQVVQQSTVDQVETEDNTYDLPDKTILDVMGLQFEEITQEEQDLIRKNLGSCSNKFYQAWKVINNKTQNKFDGFINDNGIKVKKLLFHGSRSENFWSIINMGLVLRPNAVITGKLYGNGIYFAPKAEKSLGYTSLSGSYWSKGNSNSGFMGMFNVAYGTPYDVYDFNNKYHDLNYENLQKMYQNSHSLHAHAGANIGYTNLRNDEIIVYREEQCTIQYLVELKK